MAHEESVLASPPTQDTAAHERDYSSFIKLFKYGAIICFIVGIGWMMLIKAYW
ncbi:MAG: aa3-type cytochrome c oxidase subunit IV [Sphingomicrobium sp.]